MSTPKIGIIGYGSFGQFTAGVLASHADIYLHDSTLPKEITNGTAISFDQLATMDCVILAVPLDAYETVLLKLKPLLRPDVLVVDVCSVKVESTNIIQKVIPHHQNILICHPLFGPQSAMDTTKGHDIIITDAIGDKAVHSEQFLAKKLGLKVHHISAEEHDRVMAYVHVLTFFVARGLSTMNHPHIPFQTPSYNLLTALIDFDHKHTQDLFTTIQQGNPYANEVRHKLVRTFSELEQSLLNEEV